MATNGITIKPLGAIASAFSQLTYKPPQNNVRGVETNDPFGPLQPVQPWIPITEPRALQFNPGQNLIFTPRADMMYSAADLQAFAKFPMARVLIENVKDQICKAPWQIRVKKEEGETKASHASRSGKDKNVGTLMKFFEKPNPEETWSEFIRKPLEDMLVIDAPSIWMRRSKKNQIVELRTIQGDTISRIIDKNGFTPQPPSPAYQQLWFGQPMIDFTTDDLCYKPRNILPNALYGFGPCEQGAQWLEIAILRLQWQKNFYDQGSIPDAIQIVPPTVSPDKIAEAQSWLISEWAGNLAKRRQLRMIQGFSNDGHDQILFPKEKALTDQFDDLLIRALCYAFGTSPQRLLKMQNKATATSNQSAADDEGLAPWLDWVNGVMNHIIQYKMGYVDCEFSFTLEQETDSLKEMQVLTGYAKNAVLTVNEVRDRIGYDPLPFPEADEPGAMTQNGFIPLTGGVLTNGSSDGGSKKGPAGNTVPSVPAPQPQAAAPGTQETAVNGTKKPKDKKKPAAGSNADKAACAEHLFHKSSCPECLQADMTEIFEAVGKSADQRIKENRQRDMLRRAQERAYRPKQTAERVTTT